MKSTVLSAFGPGFIPGKVKATKDVISRAMERRWGGMPAHPPVGVSPDKPPSRRSDDRQD